MHFPGKQKLVALAAIVVMIGGVSYAGLQSLRPAAPLSVAPISGSTPPIMISSPAEGKANEVSMPTPIVAPEPKEVVVAMAGAIKIPGLLHLSSEARVGDAIKRAGGAKPDADLDEINLAAKLSDGDQIYVPHKKVAKPEEKAAEPDRADHSTRIARVARKYRGGELAPRYAPLSPVMPPALKGTPSTEDKQPPTVEPPLALEPPPSPEFPSQGEPPSLSLPPRGESPFSDSSSRGTHGHRGAKARPSGAVSLNSATQADLETLPGVGPATAQKIIAYRREHGGFHSIEEITAIRGIGPKKLDEMRPYLRL